MLTCSSLVAARSVEGIFDSKLELMERRSEVRVFAWSMNDVEPNSIISVV